VTERRGASCPEVRVVSGSCGNCTSGTCQRKPHCLSGVPWEAMLCSDSLRPTSAHPHRPNVLQSAFPLQASALWTARAPDTSPSNSAAQRVRSIPRAGAPRVAPGHAACIASREGSPVERSLSCQKSFSSIPGQRGRVGQQRCPARCPCVLLMTRVFSPGLLPCRSSG
jgi:hypothetical protein